MSFLKHAEPAATDHAPEAHPHPHHTLNEVMHEFGHKISEAVVGQHVARCTVCHIELEPIDIAQGCCSDKDGCGCRAYSARCW